MVGRKQWEAGWDYKDAGVYPDLDTKKESGHLPLSPFGSFRRLQGRKCVGAKGAGGGVLQICLSSDLIGPPERAPHGRFKEKGRLSSLQFRWVMR